MHFSLKRETELAPSVKHGDREIKPEASMRWLGIFLTRKLSWKIHIEKKTAAARGVAYHVSGLNKVMEGAIPWLILKAMKAVVLPKALFGAEIWYPGPTRLSRRKRNGHYTPVRNGLADQVDKIQKTINIALRSCLPVWRTTPLPALYREGSLPPVDQLLQAVRTRHALRLRALDIQHPLAQRCITPRVNQRKSALRPTVLQTTTDLCLNFPRPLLQRPVFSGTAHKNPAYANKARAAVDFRKWLEKVGPNELVVYSDGSMITNEPHPRVGSGRPASNDSPEPARVGFGYAIYRGNKVCAQRYGRLVQSEVFDAEVEGARHALRTTLFIAKRMHDSPKITVCLDNTSVIWGLRGTPSASSQDAFLEFKNSAEEYPGGVEVKWVPGHQDIPGNELADQLAKRGAETGSIYNKGATAAYARRQARREAREAFGQWWENEKPASYEGTKLRATLRETEEVKLLSRRHLHHLLAARSGHGDFKRYHERFSHENSVNHCSCGKWKSPAHIFFCRKTYCILPWERAHPPSHKVVQLILGTRWREYMERVERTRFFAWTCTPKGQSSAWQEYQAYQKEGGKEDFNIYLADHQVQLIQDSTLRSFRESKRYNRRRTNGHNSGSNSDLTAASSPSSSSSLSPSNP
jgi:ribonuclease HI